MPDIGAFEVLSSDANLTDLVLNGGTFSPDFDSDTIDYTATVDVVIDSVTVTPTAQNGAATITVNDDPVTSGAPSSSIPISIGAEKTITVLVTAQDGTPKTYTIAVTRLPATTDSNDNGFTDLEEFYVAGLPSAFRVGDILDDTNGIDLGTALGVRPTDQVIIVTGLPRGPTRNAAGHHRGAGSELGLRPLRRGQ